MTSRYVADQQALAEAGVTGVNCQLSLTAQVLDELAARAAAGSIVPPPITRISLHDASAFLARPDTAGGKAVIVL